MEDLVKKVSDNLDQARILIEEALDIGRQHDIPVDLSRTGVGASEELWYTTPNEYLEDIKNDYGEDSEEYQEAEQQIRENNPYNRDGYKTWGWMSSSTNC